MILLEAFMFLVALAIATGFIEIVDLEEPDAVHRQD